MRDIVSKGFTLVELAVVLAIIGIIAALTTPNFMRDLNQRRANLVIEDTQMIVDASRAYRVKTGSWPGDATCMNALETLQNANPPFLPTTPATNRYGSNLSTSCTATTFSLDQSAIADWDGYIVNSLAGTQIVNTSLFQLRTTIGVPGSEPALDSKLSRIATGNAELNRMRTDLLLGGNNINEVGQINASSGVFTSGVTTQGLAVQQTATLSGLLSAQGESQFSKKATFNDVVVLNKIVVAGTGCLDSGSLARDTTGATLTCTSGVWKSSAFSAVPTVYQDVCTICNRVTTLGAHKFCTLSKVSGPGGTYTECNVYNTSGTWYMHLQDMNQSDQSQGCAATCFD